MCGRFALSVTTNEIEQFFPQAKANYKIEPRYNIAPQQNITAVLSSNPNAISSILWGLIPSWAKDPKIGNSLINAKAETILIKPAFKESILKKRCLIFATGFYEWKHIEKNKKIPYFIKLKNDNIFAFAGIWSEWSRKNFPETIISGTIITCNSNELISNIHNRMPVIIEKEYFDLWLNVNTKISEVLNLLKPYAGELMVAYRVTHLVNNPKYDNPKCTEPIEK